ncbi:MAG: hypothetical protein IPQ07_37450 [Myxococcales bacterium]|nr:hypothetical protein [Myxococcales bacterium]
MRPRTSGPRRRAPTGEEDSDGDGVSDMDEQVMEADVDVNARLMWTAMASLECGGR